MPTVIDALIVTLGLDAKNFTAQQKAAAAQIVRTQGQILSHAKTIESAGQRVGNFYSNLRTQILAIGSALLLGKGIESFTAAISNADAHIGRMSRQLGVSSETLTNWMNASKNAGGSADGMKGAIAGLIKEFQTFGLTGESSVIPLLRAMGINVADLVDKNGTLTNFQELLLRIADAFHRMPGPRAMAMGQMFGFDEGTINLLMKGREEVVKLLAAAEKIGNVNKSNTDIAEGLVASWNRLAQASENLGRSILNSLAPVLEKLMDLATGLFGVLDKLFKGKADARSSLNDWLDKNAHWTTNVVDFLNGKDRKERITKPGEISDTFADRFSAAFPRRSRVPAGAGSGTAPPEGENPGTPRPGPGTSPESLLRLKSGATGGGQTSLGTLALATALQNEIPSLGRFTALNDAYHAGTGSQHAKGLAADFTLRDPRQAEEVAEQVRKKLTAMGVDATVLDEYNHPSAGATGGHIHVQFNSRAAADRYANQTNTNTNTATTHIGTIIVNSQATDAAGVARDIRPQIERNSFTTNANSGLQ